MTDERYSDDDLLPALNKTWTRIGMGKIALANSLVGRPVLGSEEIVLLARALIPDSNEESCGLNI
ncbi:MAG: hypothetical protein ACXAB4_07580 [Candidatus Hodarchaeales archaeon]